MDIMKKDYGYMDRRKKDDGYMDIKFVKVPPTFLSHFLTLSKEQKEN